MADRPSLAETQARLFALITAPEDVAATLAARGLDAGAVEELIVSDATRSAVGRLDVYAHMYFFRLRDVLADDFPALAAVLGEAAFHNLCTDYVAACPSQHPSLRWLGARLPGFLAGREPAWWADLARLEWARVDVFDRPDAPLLDLDALRALDADALAALPLALGPAVRRVAVHAAVDEVWQAASDGGEIVEPAPGPRGLLVWRRGVEVFHRPVDAAEMEALSCLDRRPTFGALCEQLAEGRLVDDAAQLAFRLFGEWAGSGLLLDPAAI